MCLSASLSRREAAPTLDPRSTITKSEEDHTYEALNSISKLTARCTDAVCISATDVGRQSRRGGSGFHGHGEQRQDLSPLGLSRKVCGPRMAQQRVPLRAQAVQQRQHAAAAKAVDE